MAGDHECSTGRREKKNLRKITKPRPGHADLVGGIKYRFDDLRNSLERSSARETTMRVAVGAVAKRILEEIGVEVASHIVNFGGIEIAIPENLTVSEIKEKAAKSEVSIVVPEQEEAVKAYIDQVKKMAIPSGELWKPWLVVCLLD